MLSTFNFYLNPVFGNSIEKTTIIISFKKPPFWFLFVFSVPVCKKFHAKLINFTIKLNDLLYKLFLLTDLENSVKMSGQGQTAFTQLVAFIQQVIIEK